MISDRLLKLRLFTGFQTNAILEVTSAASAGNTAGFTFKCWLVVLKRIR